MNFAGELIEYLAADSLQNYITSLYRAAGLGRGFSSHSGRRTFASRLVTQGQLLETVRMLLGHSHLDHVAPYLDVSQRELHEAVAAIDLSC
ncbi:tyrosine-type recombinase/integrase [Paraburkholderia guartelaensis]|uniref:tyrosine-type recombinase/integrase n=1 Tax=Paraburkholderia guartelaensis TaxID=2546446 RepID=UPI002AB7CC5A|nr:tyrosine-type recombinase/integrase [Paraburkholderia guartelaensis]